MTRGPELQAVIREGKRIRAAHLDARTVASPLGRGRVGFVVPKYRRTGVERNRLKRRLRELTRTRLLPAMPPFDLVIKARPEAYDVSFDALRADVERVRLGLEKLARLASG